MMREVPPFQYSNYQLKIEEFKTSTNDHYQQTQDALKEYINEVKTTKDITTLKGSIYDIETNKQIDLQFMNCNDDQLREIAMEVVLQAREYLGSDEVKLLDTVYGIEANIAAYLDMPREYLYFAMDENKSKMIAYTVQPTTDGYSIVPCWTKEQALDEKYVEDQTNRLLYIYTNKVY